MGCRHFVGALFFAVTLFAPTNAAPSPSSDLATRQFLLERDVAELRNSTQQAAQAESQAQKDSAQALNTRMDDLTKRFGDFTLYCSLLGMCLTLLALGVGIAGFWTAGRKATEAANEAAKGWLTEHAGDLQRQIADLQQQADAIRKEMAEHCASVEKVAKAGAEEIGRKKQDFADRYEKAVASLDASMITKPNSDGTGASVPISESDKETLKQADEALKVKAEKDYTADDWAQRAYSSYAEEALEHAAFYFGQAANAANSDLYKWAKFSLLRAGALGRLERNAEAGAVCEAVLSRCKDAQDDALKIFCAFAFQGKALSLKFTGHREEEIAAYDSLIVHFENSGDVELREHVARALVDKGLALEDLNRSNEAIEAYDLVVSHFGEATEDALRKLVAKALVNKGVSLRNSKRFDEELAVYDDIIRRFDSDTDEHIRQIVAKAVARKNELENPSPNAG